MQTYICEICGDAYLGVDKPSECPFCGSRRGFIKLGSEALPITLEKIELSEKSRKNLETTLDLEMKANAIYLCMAGKAEKYEIKAMYKRLAKVELEHASTACKLMGILQPGQYTEICAENDSENFERTLQLEEDASMLYLQFAEEANEEQIKKFFIALAQVEADHGKVIKNYY